MTYDGRKRVDDDNSSDRSARSIFIIITTATDAVAEVRRGAAAAAAKFPLLRHACKSCHTCTMVLSFMPSRDRDNSSGGSSSKSIAPFV